MILFTKPVLLAKYISYRHSGPRVGCKTPDPADTGSNPNYPILSLAVTTLPQTVLILVDYTGSSHQA